MKLKEQNVAVVVGLVLGVCIAVVSTLPPPPVGADLTFKVGWYVGHVAGWVENLFR